MYPKDKSVYNPGYFQKRIPVLFDRNRLKLIGLYNIIQQQTVQEHYKQDLYNNFLNVILEGNMCDALIGFPEYSDADFIVNEKVCNTMRQKILTRGFAISAKYLLDQFFPTYEMLSDPKIESAQARTKKWEKEFNLREFDEFINIMLNVIQTMKNFLV